MALQNVQMESPRKVTPLPIVSRVKEPETKSTPALKSTRGRKRKQESTAEVGREDIDSEDMKDDSCVDVEDFDTSFIPRDFFCAKCPYTFLYSAIELEQHRLCHGDESGDKSPGNSKPELMCYICRPKRGRKLEGLERSQGQVWFHLKHHLHQRHNVDYQITCKLCDTVVKSHLEFKAHKTTHSIRCDVCKFTSVTQDDVTTHRKCHVEDSPRKFKCYICGYQCQRDAGKWSLMHAHLVGRHPGTIRPLYQCQQCEKGFQSLRQHRLHVPRCLKTPMCTCTTCGVKIHPNLLPAHLKTHTAKPETQLEKPKPEDKPKVAGAPKVLGTVFVEIKHETAPNEGEKDAKSDKPTSISIVSIDSNKEATPDDTPSNDVVSPDTSARVADAIMYICELHHSVFNTKEEFSDHLATEHKDVEIIQDKEETPEPAEVKHDADTKVKEKPTGEHRCVSCYKKFQSEDRLLKHIARVSAN